MYFNDKNKPFKDFLFIFVLYFKLIFVKPKSTKIMKTIKLTVIFGMVLISSNLSAQVMANSKEESSPVELSKGTSRYYYFPNLQAYFDNLNLVYYFKVNNEWHTADELPENYGGYSLYNKAYVIIKDYDGENPQQFLNVHKKLYPYNSKGRFTNATASSD